MKLKQKKSLISIVILFVLVIAFQNCGQFNSNSSSENQTSIDSGPLLAADFVDTGANFFFIN